MDIPEQTDLNANGLFSTDKHDEFVCYVCDRIIFTSNSLLKHTKIDQHIISMRMFENNFKRSDQCLICKTCNLDVKWSEVKSHAKLHNIVPWYKPHDIYKQYFDNCLVTNKSQLYCYLCKFVCSSNTWYSALSHIRDSKHMNEKSKIECINTNTVEMPDNWKELDYHRIISHCIIKKANGAFLCQICKYTMLNVETVFHHMDSWNHYSKRAKFLFSNNFDKADNEECNLIIPHHLKWLIKSDNIQVSKESLYCEQCDITMKNNNAIESHLLRHLELKSAEEQSNKTTSNDNESSISFGFDKLQITNIIDIQNYMQGKNDSRRHESDAKKKCKSDEIYKQYFEHFLTIHKDQLYCYLCKSLLTSCSWKTALTHMKDPNHVSKMSKIQSNSASTTQVSENLPESDYKQIISNCIVKKTAGVFSCQMCNCKISGVRNVFLHIGGSNHCTKKTEFVFSKNFIEANDEECNLVIPHHLKWLIKSDNIQVFKESLYCKQCCVTMKNNGAVESHLSRHLKLKNMEKQCNKVANDDQSTISLESNKSTIINIIETQNSAQNKDISEQHENNEKDKYKPSDIYKQYFENFFTIYKGQLYCYLCKSLLICCSWETALSHMKDPNHVSKMSKIQSDSASTTQVSENLSESDYKQIISNCIVKKTAGVFSCQMCNCKISGVRNVFLHIDGSNHCTKKTEFVFSKNFIEANDEECNLVIPHHLKWLIKSDNIQVFKESLYCKQCCVTMTNNSAVESHLSRHLRLKNNTEKQGNRVANHNQSVIVFKNSKLKMTNIMQTQDAMQDKSIFEQHKEYAKEKHEPNDIYKQYFENFFIIYNGQLYCYLCKSLFTSCSWNTALSHMKNPDHIVAKYKMHSSDVNVEMPVDFTNVCYERIISNCIVKKAGTIFFCQICNCRISGTQNIFQHIGGVDHCTNKTEFEFSNTCNKANGKECTLTIPSNLKYLIKSVDIRVSKNSLYCKQCNVMMTDSTAVESHLLHHLKLKENAKNQSNNATKGEQSTVALESSKSQMINATKLQDFTKDTGDGKEECKPNDIYKQYFENFLTIHKGQLYCYLCKSLFASCNWSTALGHMKDPNHISTKSTMQCNDTSNIITSENWTESDYKCIIYNCIIKNTAADFFCQICNCKIYSVKNIFHHVDGGDHCRNKKKFEFINYFDKTGDKECNHTIPSDLTWFTESDSNQIPQNYLFCEQCNVTVTISNAVENHLLHDLSLKSHKIIPNGHNIFNISSEKTHRIINSVLLSVLVNEKWYCLVCEQIICSNLQEYYEHICSMQHLKYLNDMKEDDKKIGNMSQHKILALMHGCEFNNISMDILQCLICTVTMKNDESSLAEHISLETHKLKYSKWRETTKVLMITIFSQIESSWYSVHKYRCELCNVEYTLEEQFVKHLNNVGHKQQLNETNSSKDKLTYDFCEPCGVLWFGHEDIYFRHCQGVIHKYMVIYGFNITNKLPRKAVEFLVSPEETVEELVLLSNNVSLYGRMKEKNLLHSLENEVKVYFSRAKAYPFGSRISNIGFSDSDIDVFLDIEMYKETDLSHNICQNLVRIVAYFLEKNKDVWKVEQVITSCRTPIIKAWHIPTELHCDISCSSALGVENTKIIKHFTEVYPPCRKLILFLKKWLNLCALLGSDVITSYAITWCIIFYLQNMLILPNIAELIHKSKNSKIINGWETGVCYNFYPRKVNLSFKRLLLGFFKFYADFDYKHNVVCPLLGTVVKKNAFQNPLHLPNDMILYNHNITMLKTKPFCITPMCVQDPFDLSHNLTKAIKKNVLNNFKIFCKQSVNIVNGI